MAYSNNPEPPSYSPPPSYDPQPSEGRTDGYGWQGQGQPQNQPNQPYQPYQPSQPYQQAPQQPYQPYGQPVQPYYAGPMAQGTSGYAIASLVCSLLGYVGVFGIGPLLGVIFGHLALREIKNSNGMLQGRGMAQAGLILGYIALGIVVLAIAFFLIVAIIGAGATITSPNN